VPAIGLVKIYGPVRAGPLKAALAIVKENIKAMKKQTPAPKKRPAVPAKMTSKGSLYEQKTEAYNKMDASREKTKAEMEAKGMIKKNTSKDYALIPGSTDPFKRQNKKGNLVPTKMAKEMAKKKKK
jgi:hypothetical protein